MANQVKLTFAGEEKPLTDSFDRVGDSAKRMSDSVDESSDGFKRAGEAADEVDTKAMGFRDTLTGVQDSMAGVAMLSKGPSFEGFLTLGAGIGDLGSGFYNFLIPALEKTKLATIASTVATNVASGATKAFTAAQRLLSLAFISSPIGWIVLAIGALIAVIVLIATKTDWFQRAWRASWSWIKNAAANTWEFLKKIPGWLGTAFSKVANFITAPFKSAFNAIARLWNNTVGRLSFTVPGWVPGIGGNGFSVPNIPTFHSGGVVPGVVGEPVVTLLQAGEEVSSRASAGGGAEVVPIGSDGSRLGDALIELIQQAMDRRGGDPRALGVRVA